MNYYGYLHNQDVSWNIIVEFKNIPRNQVSNPNLNMEY